MSLRNKIVLIVLAILTILCIVGIIYDMRYNNGIKSFYMGDKQISCNEGYLQSCGYTLSDCSDGNYYKCVVNVKVIKEYNNDKYF